MQSSPYQSGFAETSIGLKHVFYFDAHQIITAQGYVSPPSGGQYLGTTQTGFFINGIYDYTFDSDFSLVTNLGVASNSAPPAFPAKNYYSFNSTINLGLPIADNIAGYIETYAQSKTALNQGWGVSIDGGLIFLVKKHLTIDVSAGQRIAGYLENTNHYFSTGLVIALG